MKTTIVSLLVLAFLTSCSSGGGSPESSGAKLPNTTTPIQDSQFSKIADGIYTASTFFCSSYVQDKGYYSLVLSNTQGEFAIIKTYHSDAQCQNQLLSEASIYSLSSFNISNGVEITSLKLIDVQLSLLDNNIVSLFNSNNAYGLTWTYGNALSVVDKAPHPGDSISYVSNTLTNFQFEILDQNKFKLLGLTFIKQ